MAVIKKKAIVIFFVIILCVISIVLWRHIPRNIDVEYKGIQFDMAAKTNEEVNIKINGKLFNDSVFKGKIVIDKLDFTKEYDMLPIIFDKNVMNGAGSLVYTTVTDGKPVLRMVGTIKSNDNFSKVYISANIAENKDNLIIAGPASNLEEFNKIKKEIDK